MKQFLWDWRFVIVIMIAMLAFILLEWEKAKQIALRGALMAKKLAKDAVLNSGQEQEDWVVIRCYPLLPAAVRVLLTQERFRLLVRYLYKQAKDILDDGLINGSCGGETNGG